MLGTPAFSPYETEKKFSGCRWIDNEGSVFIDNSRFGGEAAGLPIIYHFATHWFKDGRWPRPPTSVAITNSWVFTGRPEDPNAAVLNLRTDVPTVFIYEGNFGPATSPLIVNGGNIPLDKYLDRTHFPANYFRFVIEPNEMTNYEIPPPLKPLDREREICNRGPENRELGPRPTSVESKTIARP